MSVQGEELRIRLPHMELAARVFGPADGQPVIALHGWLDNANSFARLAPKLEGLRIVALDLAGHGHSDHRPAGAVYSLADYLHDVLRVAEHLGWARFSLLGHSLGAILSAMLAGALPERVERLALIDGLLPQVASAEQAPERFGQALQAQLRVPGKRKPVYSDLDRAVEARLKGVLPVSREAAALLAQRGLMPVSGGYTWRSDSRLMLPTALRLTAEQARAFVAAIRCPARLVVAEHGVLIRHLASFEGLPVDIAHSPGGHHLHLDDEAGALSVADCFNRFFGAP